jgi:4-hydroxybenzoyl-CoA thioesterase
VKKFSVSCKVRFQHCDPAGMVFYPRYYEMINTAVEDFFEQILEMSHAWICKNGLGVPMRSIAVEFLKPSYLGDIIHLHLQPTRIGRSSIQFSLEILAESGEKRVEGNFVIVYIDNTKKKSISIPKATADKLCQLMPQTNGVSDDCSLE